jgi:hypothetical protein
LLILAQIYERFMNTNVLCVFFSTTYQEFHPSETLITGSIQPNLSNQLCFPALTRQEEIGFKKVMEILRTRNKSSPF